MTLKQAAHNYASFGYKVFPLQPGRKQPLTFNGFKDASLDAEVIEKWWTDHPSANIGIPTGEVNNLTVIDYDSKDFYHDDSYWIVETPKGYHVWYSYYEDMRSMTRAFADTDIRSDGGYVVAPPSVIDGQSYEWLQFDGPPNKDRLEPIPKNLANLILMKKKMMKKKTPAPETPPFGGEGVGEGGRNSYLTSVAGKMRRAGMELEELMPALDIINEARCDPPLEKDEVTGIAMSVCGYEKGAEGMKAMDWEHPPKPPHWFVNGLISEGDLVLIIGEPEAQKSWLALDLAVATIKGRNWVGLEIDEPGTVMYVDEENHRSEIWRRLMALGFDRKKEGDKLHYFSQQELRLDKNPERLFATIERVKPKLVILDSLIRFHTSAEDDNTAMSTLWNNGIKPISRTYGATTVILHHVVKAAESNSKRRVRGAGDIVAAIDLGLDVTIPADGEYRKVIPFKPRHPIAKKFFYFTVEDQKRGNITAVEVKGIDTKELPF